jgi:multidrug efflux system outer membrane protein
LRLSSRKWQNRILMAKHKSLLLALISSGCALVGPNYQPPADDPRPSFVNIEDEGLSGVRLEIEWWTLFNDAMLTRLVERTLAYNPDLRVAEARLREARALTRERTYELYPIVTTQANVSHGRESAELLAPGFDRDQDLYDAGFDASWELDFFGRVRRLIETRQAEAESFEANRRDVAVTLIGEVARNYLEMRGAQQRLQVATANAENQAQTLDLTTRLLEGGRGNALDVARAEAQFNSTLATIPPLQAQIKRAIHRLAVLTGQPPGALNGELLIATPIPELPDVIGVETPADLLRRRPDIRVAERNLAAFTSGIGVAVADLFPRVTLLGSVGVAATSGSGLVRDEASFYSIGPSIVWLAAFDLGRVRARIEQAEARAEGAFAQYERVVLAAFEEVESAFVTFGRERIRYARLLKAEQASTQAAELARLRYREGVANFLEVLDAERVQLAAQDQLVSSEVSAATALAALYKALGGGWQVAEVEMSSGNRSVAN